MALTQEFRYAVEQGNLLRVRIMLKDSLLVDTSFEQFNEMIRFAELKLDNLWINDEDDNEEFSQSTDELNIILAGLVNNFSKKRVAYLKKLIKKIYPPKQKTVSDMSRREAGINPRTRSVTKEFNSIIKEKHIIVEACEKVVSKKKINENDIDTIREAAINIIEHCDKISGK